LKPLLKWAGGKRWLVPTLQDIWQPYAERKLIEPFVGGMAVALGLNPQQAVLSDANEHLINFYQQVQQGLKVKFRLKNDREYYYKMRTKFNTLISKSKHLTQDAASIFYFLVRTGYNGLCRFNSSGEFNVPFGQHNKINYKTDFVDYQEVLQSWEFKTLDFQSMRLQGDEFIYADPPYDVEFTRYSVKDFVWQDQVRLAEWLCLHPGPVVASNQATDRIVRLYTKLGFKIILLSAPRSIVCNGDRQPAQEILALRGIN